MLRIYLRAGALPGWEATPPGPLSIEFGTDFLRSGRALGLTGLPLAVMVVAAALPVGANVFLFSQRYKKAEDLVTASVAVSTLMAVGTVSVVMGLLR